MRWVSYVEAEANEFDVNIQRGRYLLSVHYNSSVHEGWAQETRSDRKTTGQGL